MKSKLESNLKWIEVTFCLKLACYVCQNAKWFFPDKKKSKMYCGLSKLPPWYTKICKFAHQNSHQLFAAGRRSPSFHLLVFLHPIKELLDVFLPHHFLAVGKLGQVLHQIVLHRVVRMDGLHLKVKMSWSIVGFCLLLGFFGCDLLNPAHLPKGFHASLLHRRVKPWFLCLERLICS